MLKLCNILSDLICKMFCLDPRKEIGERASNAQDILLWETGINKPGLGHQSIQPIKPKPPPVTSTEIMPVTDTSSTLKPPPGTKRVSGQTSGVKSDVGKSQSDGARRKSDGSNIEKQPPRSILHTSGEKLKAQAKSVVVNAVKEAFEETGSVKNMSSKLLLYLAQIFNTSDNN